MKVYYDALRYLIGITAEEDRLLGKNKIFLNLCKYLRKKYKVKKEGSLLRVILSKDKEIVVGVNKNSFSLSEMYVLFFEKKYNAKDNNKIIKINNMIIIYNIVIQCLTLIIFFL